MKWVIGLRKNRSCLRADLRSGTLFKLRKFRLSEGHRSSNPTVTHDALSCYTERMRTRATLLAACFVLTTGCSSIADSLQEYGKEKLVEAITNSVDSRLEARGLSLAKLKSAVDVNGDGHIDSKEATKEAVSIAKEATLIEAKRLIDDKAREFAASHVTRDEFGKEHESLLTKAILGLFGLTSTYLGKQILSGRREAKKHANYHARMAVLEAVVGKKAVDIDGDGIPDKPKPPAKGTAT